MEVWGIWWGFQFVVWGPEFGLRFITRGFWVGLEGFGGFGSLLMDV